MPAAVASKKLKAREPESMTTFDLMDIVDRGREWSDISVLRNVVVFE